MAAPSTDCGFDGKSPERLDDAQLKAILAGAEPNVLRLALYQETRDPELARMGLQQALIWGGSYFTPELRPEHHQTVWDKAFAYLRDPNRVPRPKPTKAEARPLMEMFEGKAVSDALTSYGYEELAFEPFPRNVEWTSQPAPESLRDFKVVIIGAGMSGIALAVQLKQLGINFGIFERQAAVGGTWVLNSYPGARVDIPSANYQYKFEKNYPWKHVYATQEENQAYLEHCARKFGVYEHIRFDTEVLSGDWREDDGVWELTWRHASGDEGKTQCRVLVSASGLFSTPKLPDIPGIADFEGVIQRTTAWDHSQDFAGKRVAVIGNGSSGAQVMPRLAEKAEQVFAFQRTPQWMMGVETYFDDVSAETRWLCEHMPNYWNWYCYSGYLPTVQLRGLFEHDREWQAAGGRISERNDRLRETITGHIRAQLQGHDDLFEKSIPDYAPWGRRLVIDTGWYDALKRSNVELVTDGIETITRNGIRTSDGKEREVDMIVCALGFSTSRYLWPAHYRGRDGMTAEELWAKDGPRAYLGLAMPGFPNFFMIYGAPNSQPVTGTVSSWCEVWSRYIAQAIVGMIERNLHSIECRRDVFDRYNRELDAEMDGLIWQQEGQGCYFINEYGRQGNNMPFDTDTYYGLIERFDWEDYSVRSSDSAEPSLHEAGTS